MIGEGYRDYEDIINLPHPVSSRHPQMPLLDRAAQFSPFAALTGHEAAIRETERLTEEFVEPDEEQLALLDEKLRLLQESLALEPEVEITYFQPDARKSGGAYHTVRGRVRKIDQYARRLVFADGASLSADQILAIEGEIFRKMEQ